jgi:hypothetical protein
MKKWTIGIIIAAGVLALAGGVGIAAARSATAQSAQAGFYAPSDNGTFSRQDVNQWYCGGRGQMMGFITPQVAQLLGTTQDDVKAQLAAGKTLADLAAAKNVTQEALIQTLLGPYTDHLALMVKYGYMTQAQADTLKQQATTRLQAVVASKIGTEPGAGFGGMMRGWFGKGSSTTAPNGCGRGFGPSGAQGTQGTQGAPGTQSAPGRRGMMGSW